MSRLPSRAAALLWLLAWTAAVPAAGRPAGAGRAPGIRLTFDTEVPRRFLEMVEGRRIDDDSLDAWVDLPGNAELLRIGSLRGTLSREQLRENLRHAVLGRSDAGGRGLGSLAFDPPGDLRRLLQRLDRSREGIERRLREKVTPYLPAGTGPVDAVVRFHLGGTWSGRTSSSIFLNLSFLHGFDQPVLDGIDSIIGHEIIHMVHRRTSHLPADGADAEALFGAALSQIHAEGIARHVEYRLLRRRYPRGTYGWFARSRYDEGLAGFRPAFRRVDEIRAACLRSRDMERCRDLIRGGLGRGGATYAIGHGMALAIERALGRGTLAGTLESGPVRFFELYLQATRMLPGLPTPGEGFAGDLRRAERALGKGARVWELQNEAAAAHGSGDFHAAAEFLGELLELSPGNADGAYNLARALARSRREKEAVSWLERALEMGFRDMDLLREDPDLETLRGREDYRRLLERGFPGSSEAPKISR